MLTKTIWDEKLKRNLIVCITCEKGIKGSAYATNKGFECEKCWSETPKPH